MPAFSVRKKKDGNQESSEEEVIQEEGEKEGFVRSAFKTAVVFKGMQPSEFFQLHPQEFWWLVEGWKDQDDRRKGRSGLSQKDYTELKEVAMRAKELHKQGKWNPHKGFA